MQEENVYDVWELLNPNIDKRYLCVYFSPYWGCEGCPDELMKNCKLKEGG